MKYYADYRYWVGYRCHPCRILDGPFWDDEAADWFYKIEFVDFYEGTIADEQLVCEVPAYHIFDHPIEFVDLPKRCYWGNECDVEEN